MEQDQIQKKIIEQIAQRGLKPKPRWYFLLKDQVIKAIAIIAILIGGLAVATIYFVLTDYDWDVFRYLDRSPLEHILISLPYLWVIAFTLLIIATRYDFSKTRRGYRYSTAKVIAISLAGSIVVGAFVVRLGFDYYLHNRLLEELPLYERLTYTKHDIWIYPEQGLLSGKIDSAQGDTEFSLYGADRHLWSIHLADDATIERGVAIIPGSRVKLIGKLLGENMFQAEVVRPWGR